MGFLSSLQRRRNDYSLYLTDGRTHLYYIPNFRRGKAVIFVHFHALFYLFPSCGSIFLVFGDKFLCRTVVTVHKVYKLKIKNKKKIIFFILIFHILLNHDCVLSLQFLC